MRSLALLLLGVLAVLAALTFLNVARLGNAVETDVQWPAFYVLGERLAEVVVNGRRRAAAYAKLGTYVEQGD